MAVRGFCEGEPSWYMIEVDPVLEPDVDSRYVNDAWAVIWSR